MKPSSASKRSVERCPRASIKKTTFVVAGEEEAGTKLDKAVELDNSRLERRTIHLDDWRLELSISAPPLRRQGPRTRRRVPLFRQESRREVRPHRLRPQPRRRLRGSARYRLRIQDLQTSWHPYNAARVSRKCAEWNTNRRPSNTTAASRSTKTQTASAIPAGMRGDNALSTPCIVPVLSKAP